MAHDLGFVTSGTIVKNNMETKNMTGMTNSICKRKNYALKYKWYKSWQESFLAIKSKYDFPIREWALLYQILLRCLWTK